MIDASVIGLLGMGLGLGMIHAFDADHILAVSALSNRSGWRRSLAFCTAWALGHGMTLLSVGVVVLLLGWHLPETLYTTAEQGVGVLLIGLGLWCWWDLGRRGIRLHFHRHGGLSHMHWVVEEAHASPPSRWADHSPTFVGVLHGFAGAAPLMALMPAIHQGRVWVGVTYLVLFSLGVLISMFGFGLALGSIQDWLARRGQKFLDIFRVIMGGLALGLGSMWLAGAA